MGLLVHRVLVWLTPARYVFFLTELRKFWKGLTWVPALFPVAKTQWTFVAFLFELLSWVVYHFLMARLLRKVPVVGPQYEMIVRMSTE